LFQTHASTMMLYHPKSKVKLVMDTQRLVLFAIFPLKRQSPVFKSWCEALAGFHDYEYQSPRGGTNFPLSQFSDLQSLAIQWNIFIQPSCEGKGIFLCFLKTSQKLLFLYA